MMNTQQILEAYSDAILNIFPNFKFCYNIDEFRIFFDSNRNLINKSIDNVNIHFAPFKTDALLKLMNKVSIKSYARLPYQEWSGEFTRSHYFWVLNDCELIYYPARKPKQLIVSFSSMGKDRFDRYSKNWDPSQQWQDESAYLFFKDDSYQYYLGNDDNPKTDNYLRIIRQFLILNELHERQLFCVGGSMGGYAALYYGLLLSAGGIIVAAPQTTLRAMNAHKFRNWIKHATSTESQWRDLDLLVHSVDRLPPLYIEYGQYQADVIAADALLDEYKKKPALIVVRKASWQGHTVDTILSTSVISAAVYYFNLHNSIDRLY